MGNPIVRPGSAFDSSRPPHAQERCIADAKAQGVPETTELVDLSWDDSRGEDCLNQTANVALPPAWYAANSLAHEATLRQRLLRGKRADEKMRPEELNDGSRGPELTNAHLEGRSLRSLACHNSIALLESIEDVPAFRFVQNVVQYATSSEVHRMDTLARMANAGKFQISNIDA